MADVVCIGAHPDDVEIGMGGTVAQMTAQGLDVVIVDLTDGEPTPHGTHDLRMAEAARAAHVLGAARMTLTLPNRYLFDSVEARTELAEVLRSLKPRVIFVPFPEDAHPDHIAAAAIARGARFYAKFTKTEMSGTPHYPARVYHYMAVHLRLVREPSFVVDISKSVDVKLDALRCYESQFRTNEANQGIVPMMEAAARMWGMQIGVTAGEPFFSAEPIGIRAVTDLV
jgi:bacillithiol biosynthesis deacetylase BshB1